MKLTRGLAGYTIVEVLIVLAVTGVLFGSAMALISGQQAKTEFSQAAREFESRIRDVMNDVSTGYFTKNLGLLCDNSGGNVRLTNPGGGADTQGTNAGCVYVGRALAFNESGTYRKHSLVGVRTVPTSSGQREVSSVVEARPIAIAPSTTDSSVPNGFEELDLQSGLRVRWIRYNPGAYRYTGTIVFLGQFASFESSSTSLLNSDARKGVNLVPIQNSLLSDTNLVSVDRINEMSIPPQVDGSNNPVYMNPSGGVEICVDNGGTQKAVISIGGEGRPQGTDLVISNGLCPAP